MIIKNKDNTDFFELTIKQYEFADRSGLDLIDKQWLYVTTKTSISGRNWESTEPSLMYSEAVRLAEWFKRIAASKSVDTEMYFTEPNLSFELLSKNADRSNIRIIFGHESRPPWDRSNYAVDSDSVYVDIEALDLDLIQASESILDDLSALPSSKRLFL